MAYISEPFVHTKINEQIENLKKLKANNPNILRLHQQP